MSHPAHDGNHTQHGGGKSYLRLAVALVLSLAVMFPLTMSMVWSINDFHWNLSSFYMALVMVFPMGIIMIGVMWSMFKKRWLNIVLIAAFAALGLLFFFMGRAEAFVGNEQFLRSMIPHHSRAILVCEEATITDPEIIQLCDTIVKTQQEEIAQMNDILQRY